MAIKEIPEASWHPWMRAAMALGRQTQGWFAVVPGSEEDQAWRAYFQNLGWMPAVVNSGNPYTMPMRLPSWLPHDWEPMKTTGELRPCLKLVRNEKNDLLA